MFYICLSVRQRQNCTFCLVHIKKRSFFNLLCVLTCFLEHWQSSLFSIFDIISIIFTWIRWQLYWLEHFTGFEGGGVRKFLAFESNVWCNKGNSIAHQEARGGAWKVLSVRFIQELRNPFKPPVSWEELPQTKFLNVHKVNWWYWKHKWCIIYYIN